MSDQQDIFKNKYVICETCGTEIEYKDCYAEEFHVLLRYQIIDKQDKLEH